MNIHLKLKACIFLFISLYLHLIIENIDFTTYPWYKVENVGCTLMLKKWLNYLSIYRLNYWFRDDQNCLPFVCLKSWIICALVSQSSVPDRQITCCLKKYNLNRNIG